MAICESCEHNSGWHRFDVSRLDELSDVPWADRPFPCIGVNESGCECTNFVGDDFPERDDWITAADYNAEVRQAG